MFWPAMNCNSANNNYSCFLLTTCHTCSCASTHERKNVTNTKQFSANMPDKYYQYSIFHNTLKPNALNLHLLSATYVLLYFLSVFYYVFCFACLLYAMGQDA